MMTTAGDQIEYLPLFVYGTLLERPIRDSVLGPSVLRTERAVTTGRWKMRRTILRLLFVIRSRKSAVNSYG
jgi:hypothetical protein